MGKKSVKFYSQAEKIEFLKSNPNTFKPGLPYTVCASHFCIRVWFEINSIKSQGLAPGHKVCPTEFVLLSMYYPL